MTVITYFFIKYFQVAKLMLGQHWGKNFKTNYRYESYNKNISTVICTFKFFKMCVSYLLFVLKKPVFKKRFLQDLICGSWFRQSIFSFFYVFGVGEGFGGGGGREELVVVFES